MTTPDAAIRDADWVPFIYAAYWDVPSAFYVCHGGKSYVFSRLFDAVLDEYPDHYTIYTVSPLSDEILAGQWWVQLSKFSPQIIGVVRVADAKFDPTRRKLIHDSIFGKIHPMP